MALLRAGALAAGIGISCGAASALFLTLLEHATRFRETHEAIVYALPLAGVAIGCLYERWGAATRAGNDLVIDTYHDNAAQIPLRMAPMVLLGTVLTHLFGGSAGREGAAVQMGGSLADAVAHRCRVPRATRPLLLAAGMAGGFGSVFGTPLAGTMFAMEVVAVGRIEYRALVPALIASVIGDIVTRRLGVAHTLYPTLAAVPMSAPVLAKVALIGVVMGAAAILFIELAHHLKKRLALSIVRVPLRMCAGGLTVVIGWRLLGTSDYLGLGIPTILRAFADPELPAYAPWAKMVMTSITLASGFVGGEVTPLFFMGATLGNVTARAIDLPIALGAGLGMAALFGAAANTPIALTIMAAELLGTPVLPYAGLACAVAYIVTGRRSIYSAQRFVRDQHGRVLARPVALRELRDQRDQRARRPRV